MATSSMDELGRHFDALARLLASAGSAEPHPERVVQVALAALSAEEAGLTLLRERERPRTLAATGEVVTDVDAMQYERQEGPCWEAATEDDLVRADDLCAERRWGGFGPWCARETGIRSMLSVRLRLPGTDRGAMNFYSRTVAAFDERDEDVAALFAPFASLALQSELQSRRAEQLSQALVSSRRIGTAVGIVMARELLTEEQAFQRLVEASQHLNRKLRDVADQVAETGELPRAEPRGLTGRPRRRHIP